MSVIHFQECIHAREPGALAGQMKISKWGRERRLCMLRRHGRKTEREGGREGENECVMEEVSD